MPKKINVEVEKDKADEPKEEQAQFYVAMPVYLLKPSQVQEMEDSAEKNKGKGDPVSLPDPDHYVFQAYGGPPEDEEQDVLTETPNE